jgi:alkylated DNA repair protein alkB homolog 8
MSKAEEKQKLKQDKKLNKKVAKAIGIILHHENKKPEEIFSENPTKNLWCYHFGNGDEEDQIKIKKYFEQNYGNGVRVIIYPGISYGFIELNSLEIAENIIKQQKVLNVVDEEENIEGLNKDEINNLKNENLKKYLQKKNQEQSEEQENGLNKNDRNKKGNPHSHTKIKTFYHNINFDNGGDRTVFTIFSKIPNECVQQNNICNFPNAQYKVDIPGLYVFEDYITFDQESSLIQNLDKNKWDKLTNRRVQHYGYEFIYGANIIDKHNKIGEMPEFTLDLMTSNLYFNIFIFKDLRIY